ncbi:pilus assembly protein N-terminal domain-containing protein [Orrella sp. JC864]
MLCTAPVLAWAGAAAAQQAVLSMQVGETQVLEAPDVRRVAVGDSQVVQAATAEGREVLVFARGAGSTTLHVWTGAGGRRAYAVEVAPAGMRRARAELDALLAQTPGARSRTVGEKIVIEGEGISDADQARIAALAQRYPQVIDFTSQVGWDSMILLDVQVIEVPSSRLRELGVRWDPSAQGGLAAGLAWEAASPGLQAAPGEPPLAAGFPARPALGYFGLNALVPARLQALAQSGEAVVLAQPQLMARSGATASFLAGGEVPYATTDEQGRSNTVFKPYGVSLSITPRAERNGTVRSRIDVEVSAVDASVSTPSGPALSIRRASTEFNVRSGQTLVLGGFLSREQARDQSQVPGLGSLPVLGALFRSERFQRRETELAIFVTPVLVSPDDPDMAERVRRGRQEIGQAFPEAPRLNGPVRGLSPRAGWDPYAGPGSQWTEGLRHGNRHDLQETVDE